MKRIALLLLALALPAFGQEMILDVDSQNTSGSTLNAYEKDSGSIEINLWTDGAIATPTGTVTFWFATNGLASTEYASITGAITGTNQIQLSYTTNFFAIPTPGSRPWTYGVSVGDKTYGNGKLYIKNDPFKGGGVLDLITKIIVDYTTATQYIGTAASGPVRPDGVTITNSTNADGSITIYAVSLPDNLGNHTATMNLDMGNNSITNVAASSVGFNGGVTFGAADITNWKAITNDAVTTEADPVWTAASNTYLTAEADPIWVAASSGVRYAAIDLTTNDMDSTADGAYRNVAETDPVWIAASGSVVYTESDPIWTAASNTAVFLDAQYPNAVLKDGSRTWTGPQNAGGNDLTSANLTSSRLTNVDGAGVTNVPPAAITQFSGLADGTMDSGDYLVIDDLAVTANRRITIANFQAGLTITTNNMDATADSAYRGGGGGGGSGFPLTEDADFDGYGASNVISLVWSTNSAAVAMQNSKLVQYVQGGRMYYVLNSVTNYLSF